MKTKVIKRKFEDQEDTGTTRDEDAAANAAPHLTGELQQQQAGWSLHLPPALPVVLSPVLGAWALRASGWQGVVGRMLGPKTDAD